MHYHDFISIHPKSSSFLSPRRRKTDLQRALNFTICRTAAVVVLYHKPCFFFSCEKMVENVETKCRAAIKFVFLNGANHRRFVSRSHLSKQFFFFIVVVLTAAATTADVRRFFHCFCFLGCSDGRTNVSEYVCCNSSTAIRIHVHSEGNEGRLPRFPSTSYWRQIFLWQSYDIFASRITKRCTPNVCHVSFSLFLSQRSGIP